MKLSGELFHEIISRLKSDNSAGQHNKRQEPRVGVRVQGLITPWTLDDDAPGKATPVTIRDLSPAGICILSNVAMKSGFRFVLQLQRTQRETLQAVYEVRYCKSLASSLFAIGGKLVSLSDPNSKSTAA